MIKIKVSSILLGCVGALLCINSVAVAASIVGGGILKNGALTGSGATISAFALSVQQEGSKGPVPCVASLINQKLAPGDYPLDFSKCPQGVSPTLANGLMSIKPGSDAQPYNCPVKDAVQWVYQQGAPAKVTYNVYPGNQGQVLCQVTIK
ncbi:MAG: hypothetical protein A3F41_04425 [Coxiella sp. RIFCSPHIGHO2_12_FULL_44_14]|nr:MAG: hypothetical protein A3F41_04425 [Coxiella sp. RIFCSPHIGHO2_12_FULL_44_14]